MLGIELKNTRIYVAVAAGDNRGVRIVGNTAAKKKRVDRPVRQVVPRRAMANQLVADRLPLLHDDRIPAATRMIAHERIWNRGRLWDLRRNEVQPRARSSLQQVKADVTIVTTVYGRDPNLVFGSSARPYTCDPAIRLDHQLRFANRRIGRRVGPFEFPVKEKVTLFPNRKLNRLAHVKCGRRGTHRQTFKQIKGCTEPRHSLPN